MSDDRTAPTREASIAAPRPVDAALPLFAAIGRYKILGLLGRGGMGDVYLGLDEQLERQVAIKLLSRRLDPPTVSDRLQREALALARLAHPNVVAIHEVGESAGQVYLAMERIAGVTLRTWLAEEKHGLDEILAVMLQAGRGLAAAHAAGLVHRDFKPDNVMVGADGRVRVMDFGIACAADGHEPEISLTVSSTRLLLRDGATSAGHGTPGYMAPEQCLGGLQDARCDIFSFCVVLFEALHGQRPFLGDGALMLREAVLRGQIVAVRSRQVPAWLDAVIRRGLLGDPAARWATMDDLLAALTPAAPRSRRTLLRGVGLLALVAAFVLSVSLGVGALRHAAAREQAERLAEDRLAAAEALILHAEVTGAAGLAEATFASFVADPAHRGTRALTRAWQRRGDQLRAAGSREDALHAYARAYLEAREPGEAAALMRTMAAMFRAHWDGPALAQALATLRRRGLASDADAALALDAALLQGDLVAAAASVDPATAPAWHALFATLARARPGGLPASRVVPLPAGGPVALVALDPAGQGLVLLDRALAPVRRVPADGRKLALVSGAPWALAVARGQAELLDLAAPQVPLWRGPSASPGHTARALDLDGDGAQELVFARSWPDLGFRVLTGLGGPAARERVAHAGTEASESELADLGQADLDGDGTQELVAALGSWNAFDLRVFHSDERGELELLARRRFGHVAGLTALRRGDERLLAVVNDEHCPSPELFPTAPHTGEPAGVHLLRWTGAGLLDADFLPLPRSDSAAPAVSGWPLLAADLDGDGTEELIFGLSHAGAGVTVLVRQSEAGLDARPIHGLRPLAVAQLDDDPASELLVRADVDLQLWALGVGEAPLPTLRPAPIPPRAVPPALQDPLLVDRWLRADELAGVGLLAPAAASLGEVAAFTADPSARRALIDHAADLRVRAGDDAGALALTAAAPEPGPAALARDALALARLGRYEGAQRAALALEAHPERSPAQHAAAAELRARLAALVAPGARVDLDFTAPLAAAWQLRRPASLRLDPGRGALGLTIAADTVPVAELPLAWDGGAIALEYELDLQRLEYGACVHIGLTDEHDDLWLGAGICGIGGGGRLLHVGHCKLGGAGWTDLSEVPVPSAVVARHLVVRVAAFADGTRECSIVDGDRRHHASSLGAPLPLPGPLRLGIGAFGDQAGPTFAAGHLRRIVVHGARVAPEAAGEPRSAAARLFVEGEPAAALAALDAVVVSDPRDALLQALAHDDLRDPTGLARAIPGLLPHLDDPTWQADLALLLRTRPAVAMALAQAAKSRLLPALARTWAVMRPHYRDPEIQRSALAELRGLDPLRPNTPEERLALRSLLVMRGGIREQLGHRDQARRDLEAALAVPATALADDVAERVHAHVQLARLLAPDDLAAARAHAAAAEATSLQPELLRDRLAAIPGLR